MRILVCGSRDWNDKEAIIKRLLPFAAYEDVTVIHGAAKGADSLAGDVAKMFGFKVEEYPADWEKHGRAAGPLRNRKMLEEGKPNIVLAFPLKQSIGTRHMVKIASEAGVEVKVYRV